MAEEEVSYATVKFKKKKHSTKGKFFQCTATKKIYSKLLMMNKIAKLLNVDLF